MKKLVQIFAAVILISTSVSSVVSCNKNNEVTLFEDRSQSQIAQQDYIDKWLDAGNKYQTDKKIILIGLDGIAYDRATPILFDGVEQSFVKRYAIQNFESYYGWTSIYFGNIFGNTKNSSTRNIFETLDDGGLTTSAETNGFASYVVDSYNTDGPNGEWFMPDESNELVSFYTRPEAVKAKAELNINKINEITENDSWDMFYIYNVIADECGHAHFGYDTVMMKTILSEYNKILRKFFDPTLYNPEKYLVIATTDHGRNADGWNHSDEESLAHESWVVANQNLDDVMNANNKTNDEEFANFYDIKEAIFKWMGGGQNEN